MSKKSTMKANSSAQQFLQRLKYMEGYPFTQEVQGVGTWVVHLGFARNKCDAPDFS